MAGFTTMVLPVARAGATLWATRFSGKLNGVIAEITPRGKTPDQPEMPVPAGKGVDGHQFPVGAPRLFRGGGEGHSGAGDFGLGKGHRLARLGDHERDKLGLPRFDAGGHAQEQRGAGIGGDGARLRECGVRGGEGSLDFRGSTQGHLRDFFAGVTG